jgi:hypothetical protein
VGSARKISPSTGVRSPDRPSRSESLYRMSYPLKPKGNSYSRLDVHESVHRDTTLKIANKMHCIDLIYYSKSALHVSGDVFAHNQEHHGTPAGSSLGEHYQIL